MVGCVEKMGKEFFFEFYKFEGDGKGCERLWKEIILLMNLKLFVYRFNILNII